MSIVSLASYNSQFRGCDYYEEKKVLKSEQLTESTYHGVVSGSSGEQYDVTIDVAHPRKSTCTCPHAAGRRVICKHMVALYFTFFPNEAASFLSDEDDDWDEEDENWENEDFLREEIDEVLGKVIQKMKKAELQEALADLLTDAPDWLYIRFARTYLDLDEYLY